MTSEKRVLGKVRFGYDKRWCVRPAMVRETRTMACFETRTMACFGTRTMASLRALRPKFLTFIQANQRMGAMHVENIILIGSLLLLASLLASKTSHKLGIPTLILFLAIGMLAGSEGFGGIEFDDPGIAQLMGIVALNIILFSGGMDTRWESVKPILWRGVSLSTIGIIITAATIGLFVHLITDLTILEGLLLGSIVSSTDAAAVFSILRTRSIGLKGTLRPTLELESGSNDPMAYILTISFIELITSVDASIAGLIVKFVLEMVIGGIFGYALGRLMIFTINKVKMETEGLYPVLILAMIFFTFSITDLVGGNGFLSVYISALVLGNSNFIHKKKYSQVL